jgi:hypothetical protein
VVSITLGGKFIAVTMCNTFYTENVKSMKRLMEKVGLTSAIVWKSDSSMTVSVAGSVFFVT